MKNEKGFTLIELMIVVAIIGILAAIAIPRFAQLIDKAREAGARGNLGALRSATSIYYGDNKGQWPVDLTETVYTLGTPGEPFPGFIPSYMSAIPKATLQRSNSHNNKNNVVYRTNFDVNSKHGPNHSIQHDEITDNTRGTPHANGGGWIYASNSGDVRIQCGCYRDTTAVNNPGSVLYYSNYGHEEP